MKLLRSRRQQRRYKPTRGTKETAVVNRVCCGRDSQPPLSAQGNCYRSSRNAPATPCERRAESVATKEMWTDQVTTLMMQPHKQDHLTSKWSNGQGGSLLHPLRCLSARLSTTRGFDPHILNPV